MSNRETLTPKEFRTALVGGRRDFSYVVVKGNLNLNNNLYIRSDLSLSYASVEGNLDFRNSFMEGNLGLNDISVKGDVNFSHASMNGYLGLSGASIEKNLHLDLYSLRGGLYLNRASVGGEVFVGNNIALALTCFLKFGKGINVDYQALATLSAQIPKLQLVK